MILKNSRNLVLTGAVAALCACSTAMDRATQQITIETPGTEGAICRLTRPGYDMRIWTPKTVRINKTEDPLTLTCLAPGNREKQVVVKPQLASSFFLNVGNGMLPGAVYDYESGAMFAFPEKVVVDFSQMPPQRMPPPDYQQVLDENPGIFDMEEFRPGRAALQRDRDYVRQELQPRRTDADLFSDASAVATGKAGQSVTLDKSNEGSMVKAPAPASSTTSASGKTSAEGNSSADQLTRQMNPQIFGGGKPVIGSGASSSTLTTSSSSSSSSLPLAPVTH